MSFCFPCKSSESSSYTGILGSFTDKYTSKSSLPIWVPRNLKAVSDEPTIKSRVVCSPTIKSEVLNYICCALIVAAIVCLVTILTLMSIQPHFHVHSLIHNFKSFNKAYD